MGYALTLPDQEAADHAVLGRGGDGHTAKVKAVRDLPLARAELDEFRARQRRKKLRLRVDAVHLSQYDGTPYVAWMGRRSDGMFHRIGRILEVIRS